MDLHQEFTSYQKTLHIPPHLLSPRNIIDRRKKFLIPQYHRLQNLPVDIEAREVRFALLKSGKTLVMQLYDLTNFQILPNNALQELDNYLYEETGQGHAHIMDKIFEFAHNYIWDRNELLDKKGVIKTESCFPRILLPKKESDEQFELIFYCCFINESSPVCRIGYSLLKI